MPPIKRRQALLIDKIMDAVGCPSPSLPSQSWQFSHHYHRHQQTLPRSRCPELYLASRSCNQIQPRHRTRALNSLFIAVATSPDVAPRDASVLIPISALLLSVYWFANFFMPGIIVKDLEKNDSVDEGTPIAGAEISDEEEASSRPRKPILKVKNGKITRATSSSP